MIFKVDKKRVIYSVLRWQIIMELLLLFLRDNFNVIQTLKRAQFWWFSLVIIVIGLLVSYWEINEGKIVFEGNKLFDFAGRKDGVDLNELSEIKKAKTIYGRCLGLEYKVPKGPIARELLQYNYFAPKTLRGILQEIKKINPQIELDDTTKQMLTGE